MTRELVVNSSTAAITQQKTHKGCNSTNCCSPSKLWRTLQGYIKSNDQEGLHTFLTKDPRQSHILRVALTSRLSNDASMFPASQQHKLVRLPSGSYERLLGKSFTDLNSIQLALICSDESLVLELLNQVKANAGKQELKSYLNHIWGQGNTCLHLAVYLKRFQVVKLLLDLGCNWNHLNARKKNALDICQDDHIKQLLLSRCCSASLDVNVSDSAADSAPSSGVVNKVNKVIPVANTKLATPVVSSKPAEKKEEVQVVSSTISVVASTASVATTTIKQEEPDVATTVHCNSTASTSGVIEQQQQEATIAPPDCHEQEKQDHLLPNDTLTTTTTNLKQSQLNSKTPTTNVYNINYYFNSMKHLTVKQEQQHVSLTQDKKPPDILLSFASIPISCF